MFIRKYFSKVAGYLIYSSIQTNKIMQNMKNFLRSVTLATAMVATGVLLLVSCNPDEEVVTSEEVGPISEEIKSQFTSLGFDVSDIARAEGGYLLEGDILVTPQALDNMLASDPVIVNGPEGEQYRTSNLVSRNLRTIRIRATSSQSRFLLAIDRAIYNYNQLGLTFNMVRVASNQPAEITIRLTSNTSFLGSAGFPTGNGLPWNDVLISTAAFNGDDDSVEETVTHEIGHCLGLRHSDWYDRSLSCGQGGSEGSGGVGAIGISGTVRFDRESLMNSCGAIVSDPSGEFSFYDRVALRELY